MKIRKIRSLICVLLVLAFALPAVVACGKKAETPEQKFTGSMNKTTEQVRKWEEFKIAGRVLDGGSIRLQATVPADGNSDKDTDIDTTYYFNRTAKAYAINTSFTTDGKTGTLAAWMDPDRAVVQSEDLLGGAYGINFNTFADQLEKSFLTSGKGEDMMSEDEIALVKMIPGLLRKLAELGAKDQKTFDKLSGLFFESVFAVASVQTEAGTASVFGKDVKSTNLTVTIDRNAMAAILDGFWTSFKADAEIKTDLDSVIPLLQDFIALAEKLDREGEDLGKELAGAADESALDLSAMPDLSGVRTAEELYAALDPLVNEGVDAIRALPKLDVQIKLALNKSGMIMRADMTVDVSEATVVVVLELGEKLTSFEGFSLAVTLKMQGFSADLFAVKAEISENTKTNYAIDLTASIGFGPTAESVTASLKCEKKTGKTVITVNVPDEDPVNISLTYTRKKGVHTFSDLEIKGGSETVDLKNVTLTIREKDTMPVCPEYTDLMTLSESEAEALFKRIEEKFNEFKRGVVPLPV